MFDKPLPITFSKKKDFDNTIDPVLYSDNCRKYDIIFLLESYISKSLLNALVRFIKLQYPRIYIKIVCPLPYKEIKGNINAELYKKKSINLSNFIPKNSKIISIGQSIECIIKSNDLGVENFHEFIFNKTYFYSPDLKSYIFPVDSLNEFLQIKNNFPKLYDNFSRNFFLRQIKIAIEEEYDFSNKVEKNLIRITTKSELNTLYEKYKDSCILALDIETNGVDFMLDRIGTIQFAFDSNTGYFIDWNIVDVKELSQFLKNKKIIAHNGKFDFKFLIKAGINQDDLFLYADTYQMYHVLNEVAKRKRLKSIAWIYTKFGGYDNELDEYKKKFRNTKNYLDIKDDVLFKYSALDPVITFECYNEMQKQLEWIDNNFYEENEKWKLSNYFYDIVMPAVNMFVDIEYRGVYINIEELQKISEELNLEIKEVEKQVYQVFNISEKDINIYSDEQIGKLLEKKNWPCYGTTKKGHYFVNDDTLTKWKKNGYKDAGLILKLHELSTRMKTFVGKKEDNSGMWQYIRKHDDGSYRVHPDYFVMLADSGRNRCSNPNMQNQLSHGSFAEKHRKIYKTPTDDFYISEFDLSSYQLKIGSILSGDKNMQKAFIELPGGDIHSFTAQYILCRDVSLDYFIEHKKEEPYYTYRFKAKGISFSLLFNTSAYSFVKQSLENEWSLEEVNEYIKKNELNDKLKNIFEFAKREFPDATYNFCKYWTVASDIKKKWFEQYPQIREWIDNSIQFAEENGYIKSVYGAIRRFPSLLLKGKDDRQSHIKSMQNITVNSPVQNFEISQMMLNMVELWKFLKENNLKSKLFGTVHDSVDAYIYKPELRLIRSKIKEIFERNVPENKGVPQIAELEISDYSKGEVWGFGQEI